MGCTKVNPDMKSLGQLTGNDIHLRHDLCHQTLSQGNYQTGFFGNWNE